VQVPVIYFDGLCHLCNGFVNFVLDRDKKRKFYFAPLQGETYKAKISGLPGVPVRADTILLQQNENVYFRSSAILRILGQLGGPWYFMSWMQIVPAFLRNSIYDFIAVRRYAWFGRDDVCRMPRAGEKDRFLS
jgi:predicted DCC family thiol-disulfide oxidoreductase YuxK